MTNDYKMEAIDWGTFKHYFKRLEITAKTVLLKEGDVSKNAYYIEKGCMREWFSNNGKDITFQFFFEKQGVSSIESFRTGKPSAFNIETVEPCVVHSISKKNFEAILVASPEIQKQIEAFTFQRLILYQKLFLSHLRDNPVKRYRELMENNPEIIQRIPQHYIASFLGITPVSLSRIRNRRSVS